MKHIVTVGGGTGSYTVLSGLKNIPDISLTALVSMADDGGSTGVLRDELGVLPPGDVRQCLVALSEHSDMVRKLMNYRFSEGKLAGHSFGNIFLAALEKVTGDFVQGVEIASEILKVKGKVIPITANKAHLSVVMQDGKRIIGESTINHTDLQSASIKSVEYMEDVNINPHAKSAILEADMIILGPGNYYCSIVPNLIVKGFQDAIRQTPAIIVLLLNLTNKQGHTLHWKASEYVAHTETYLGKPVDIILVNSEQPSDEQVLHYKMEEGDGVLPEDDLGDDPRVVREKLLSTAIPIGDKSDIVQGMRSFIRHDKNKLKEAIAKIS